MKILNTHRADSDSNGTLQTAPAIEVVSPRRNEAFTWGKQALLSYPIYSKTSKIIQAEKFSFPGTPTDIF